MPILQPSNLFFISKPLALALITPLAPQVSKFSLVAVASWCSAELQN